MKKRLDDFSDCHLYCITTASQFERDYRKMVRSACEGGADIIQLREKNISTKELMVLCKDLQEICNENGALFILNDRVDIAYAADLDGVHVGQHDLSVLSAREILGHRKIVGCSAHSVSQALKAHGDGADYVSCGPLFATPTKPDYKPVGLDLIKQYQKMVRLPFVAIGGISEENVRDVILAGADRVAVVRGVCGSDDIKGAAQKFKRTILKAKEERTKAVVSVVRV